MSQDIATLGLAVDSSQVNAAAKAARRFSIQRLRCWEGGKISLSVVGHRQPAGREKRPFPWARRSGRLGAEFVEPIKTWRPARGGGPEPALKSRPGGVGTPETRRASSLGTSGATPRLKSLPGRRVCDETQPGGRVVPALLT